MELKVVRLWHLIRILDCDFQPPEDLPFWRMLVDRELKHVLWVRLSVEYWRVIVQVHHADHHWGHAVVQQLALGTDFRSLDITIQKKVVYDT